jgi:ribose transport system substrate-binding protein
MQANVDAAYGGQYTNMPTSSPPAVKSANVWMIDCLETVTPCAIAAEQFQTAIKDIGWKGTAVDGQSDPVKSAQAIGEAVAAKAQAIILVGFDCSTVQTAVKSAVAAKIPVFGISSADCTPGLYTGNSTLGGLPFETTGSELWAKGRADWGIVQTKGQAKAIVMTFTSTANTTLIGKTFVQELDKCTTCSIVDQISITYSTIGNMAQLFSEALLQHPDANLILESTGSATAAGLVQAMTQAGHENSVAVAGGQCTNGEIPLMKKGWDVSCYGYSIAQFVWQAVDWINRTLSGQTPSQLPLTGAALQMVDATHNLPSGTTWTPPVNFQSDYEKLWGIN